MRQDECQQNDEALDAIPVLLVLPSNDPFFGEGHLFFFTHVGSFFWHDLQKDGRYALHCSVEDQYGGEGEFFIKGNATITGDPDDHLIELKTSVWNGKELNW